MRKRSNFLIEKLKKCELEIGENEKIERIKQNRGKCEVIKGEKE